MSNKRYKILAISGGGIRGICAATILKALPKINYNLLAGTSTGAIMVALLATGYSIDDIIEFYSGDEAKRIFKPNLLPPPISNSKFSSKNITSILKEKFKDKKLKDVNTDILIVSYDINNREPVFFSNLNEEHKELYILDVVMASTAAPYYFEPYCFNNSVYVDGGLVANNPSNVAYAFVRNKLKVIKPIIVSIGTGSFYEVLKASDLMFKNPIKFVVSMIDCFMDGGQALTDMISEDILNENYIKYQIKLDEKTKSMDNVSKENIEALIKFAEELVKIESSCDINKLC